MAKKIKIEVENQPVYKKIIKIVRSKKGIPCLWNNKSAIVKKRVYFLDDELNLIPDDNVLFKSNKKYLYPLKKDFYILKIFEDDGLNKFTLFKLDQILSYSNHAIMSMVMRGVFAENNCKIFKKHVLKDKKILNNENVEKENEINENFFLNNFHKIQFLIINES